MLDNNMTIHKEEAKVYPPLPKNIYQVEILDINLKDAKGKYSKPGDKNFSFQFTLLHGKDKENELRGRNVWSNFVPTALYIGKNGKNDLYQIVEAVLGRELTLEEEALGLTGERLNSFIGKQLKIFVDHKTKDDKTYDNITSYIYTEEVLTPLNSEEKENARVKKNDDKKEQTEISQERTSHENNEIEEELKMENIPF
jgi:hypothetical protein